MSSQPLVARGAGQRRLHYRRSRNGCQTCKRRKVRCGEQRPACHHCQRLNLECIWKDTGLRRSSPSNAAAGDPPEPDVAALNVNCPSPSSDLFNLAQSVVDHTEVFSMFQDIYLPDSGDFIAPSEHTSYERATSTDLDAPASPLALARSANIDVEDSLLLHTPPLLDPVENGPMCASLRALFDSMAASSPMVRHSIAAFAAIQTYSAGEKKNYLQYYDKAANELSNRVRKSGGSIPVHSNELRYVLTTIFFLTYVNFLTGRLDLAYSNLAKAHNALLASGTAALGSVEQRIISWIRLSDARAALAGGEGLLVNDTSGIYPLSPSSTSPSTGPTMNFGPHEVIYDMLCQPGIAFFQEVQTITGRITRIAHCHRSRGSVEDETEVMAIAANITRDLSSLYDRRPALMDHAVSGNIPGDTLAEPLASSIIRSFQTYLANFYVCYIHLHRVAHRHLAHSKAVVTAISKIKEILHYMVNNNTSIPVNMLWPLFLWGSEEDDHEECEWILKTVSSLRCAATNATMIAKALQEIQRRQREAGTRVDIRSICLELFSATFVII